jgi:hypothetical protein
MQLDSCQRRALLCKTQYIFAKGFLLAGDYPYLGDVMQKNEQELQDHNPRQIGSTTTEHIGDVVRELTGFHLGTKFDKRTQLAFMEAKKSLEKPGVKEDDAWPKWYANGDPAPPAHK